MLCYAAAPPGACPCALTAGASPAPLRPPGCAAQREAVELVIGGEGSQQGSGAEEEEGGEEEGSDERPERLAGPESEWAVDQSETESQQSGGWWGGCEGKGL